MARLPIHSFYPPLSCGRSNPARTLVQGSLALVEIGGCYEEVEAPLRTHVVYEKPLRKERWLIDDEMKGFYANQAPAYHLLQDEQGFVWLKIELSFKRAT